MKEQTKPLDYGTAIDLLLTKMNYEKKPQHDLTKRSLKKAGVPKGASLAIHALEKRDPLYPAISVGGIKIMFNEDPEQYDQELDAINYLISRLPQYHESLVYAFTTILDQFELESEPFKMSIDLEMEGQEWGPNE